MEFDSIVSFILILLFFILPSIIKRLKVKKKQPAGVEVSKISKKLSVFEKIGGKIRQFVEELEKQAQLENRVEKRENIVWDDLVDGQEEYQTQYRVVDEDETVQELFKSKAKPIKTRIKQERKRTIKKAPRIYRFKSNQLQNAVIWSEILSSPVALKQDLNQKRLFD